MWVRQLSSIAPMVLPRKGRLSARLTDEMNAVRKLVSMRISSLDESGNDEGGQEIDERLDGRRSGAGEDQGQVLAHDVSPFLEHVDAERHLEGQGDEQGVEDLPGHRHILGERCHL